MTHRIRAAAPAPAPTGRGRGLALSMALALAAGCSGTVPGVPVGANVTCASSDDCPSGSTCATVLGRCVPSDTARQAPAISPGTASVTPAVARAGTVVTVTFQATEELAVLPEVRFAGAQAALGTARRDGSGYTLQFPATTDAGAGTHAIVATLADAFGNVADAAPVGAVTLDFTPPSATPPEVTPAFARQGATLTAVLTLSEPVGAAPALALDPGAAFSASPGPGANQWTFQRRLDGTEPEGAVDLVLSARDVAGNELVQRFTGAARVDFTPPHVAAADVTTPTARSGDIFVGQVRFDEPLGQPPDVRLVAPGGAAAAVTASAVDALTWALSYQIPVGAADGDHALRVMVSADRAGNGGDPAFLGTVRLDSTPPAIVGLAVDHPTHVYRAGQPIAVTFSTDEALAGPPLVRLEILPTPRDLACVAGAARAWTCTSPALDGTERPESLVNVSVRVADAAGNVTVAPTSLVLDFTPPTLAAAASAQLLPGASNLRPTITALGAGSTYRLSLMASEPLAGAPAVVAWDPGLTTPIALTLLSQSGTSYVYQLSTGAGVYPPATWTVRWDPIDVAGNRWPAPQQVATLTVDSEPPPAPATGPATAPLLLWTRVPWGTSTSAAASFRLIGQAGATSGADLAIAWDGDPQAGGREVGRSPITAGAFDLALSTDPNDLWVSALDAAGNQSAAVRVVDVAWTAGLAGKIAGSTFENPHRLESRTASLGAIDQQDAVDVGAASLGLSGDGLVVQTAGASFYRPVAGTVAPPARRYFALAYDAGRGRTVLFGGQTVGGGLPGDTWEWDGNTWTAMAPADPEGDGNPETWDGVPAFYDPIDGGVVVVTQESWLWNGASWRQLTPYGSAPGRRDGSAVAWDEARGVAVLFGGTPLTEAKTFEWDGAAWTDVTPASPSDSPSARYHHAMAYDRVRGKVLVFGGMDYATAYNDVWEWDGAARRWSLLAVAGTPPAARTDFAMAWDAAAAGSGELVVQGGGFMGGGLDGRTWVLRQVGSTPTWIDATPATTTVGTSHAAVYDAGARKVLMLGAWWNGGATQDPRLRAWSGSAAAPRAWSLLSPGDPEGDGNPVHTAVNDGASVWHPSRGVVAYHDDRTRDTWEWNHASWAHLATATSASPPPSARSGASLGYSGGSVILFGGDASSASLGDTWSWNGATWSLVDPAAPRTVGTSHYPNFREYAGLVTNPSNGKLYRFGGSDMAGGAGVLYYSDIHEWTPAAASRWTKIGGGVAGSAGWSDPQGDGSPGDGGWPSEVASARGFVVWDPGRGDVGIGRMIFYARSPLAVWEWIPPGSAVNPNSWVKHTPTSTGSWPTSERALFYDATLGAPVLVSGGLLGGQAWVIDLDADLLREIPLANPFGLGKPDDWVGAFDGDVGRAVIVAGAPYAWESGSATRPAHVLHVDYARANGPDPGACVVRASCPIQQIDVQWRGGGSAPGGSGARLEGWTGAWTALTSVAGSAAGPADAAFTWTAAAPFPASSLFHGRSHELTFQLVPANPSTAAGTASVGTDSASVTIRYRRP